MISIEVAKIEQGLGGITICGSMALMPADLKRLHKFMLDIERIDHISDEMRAVVGSEWPELARKLPPKKPQC